MPIRQFFSLLVGHIEDKHLNASLQTVKLVWNVARSHLILSVAKNARNQPSKTESGFFS